MKKIFNKWFVGLFAMPVFILMLAESVYAHCPLCTIGAGAAAAGAVWLGISKVIVALFIGAFAMSMGMWFARIVKKKYLPFQKTLIIVGVFVLTVLPLMPIFSALGPLYIPFVGEYGTTYAIDYSLISSLFGGVIVFVSPSLSRKIKDKRNGKGIPFQGLIVTFALLIITSLLIQFVII